MATTAKGMYHPYAHHRGLTVGSFKIAQSASPTVSDDPGGIVQAVAKTDTGEYTVTLKRNYSRIHAVANNDALEYASRATSVVAGGTQTNAIVLTSSDTTTGVADDANGSVTTVAFFGYDS